MVPQKMDLLYLLLPIIGAFILLFTVCCCGRKVKQILHFPKEVAIGGRAQEQVPDSDDGSSWGSDDLDIYGLDTNEEIDLVTEETPLANNQEGENSTTYLMDELIAGNLMESNRSVTACSPNVSVIMRNCYKERSHSMQQLSDDSGCFIHDAVDRTCLNSGGIRRSVSVCVCDTMRRSSAQLGSSIDSCWRPCDDCAALPPHFKQNAPLHASNSYSSSDFEIGSQVPSNSHVCVVPIMHHRDETDTPVER